MKEIDELGIATVMRQALEVASRGGSRPVHLSLDMDVVDPLYAPGVGTPVDGGLSFREAHLAMELIGQSRALVSMEVVEVNPILDQENRTGRLAAGLAASALGKRIL
jgi:arginase